MSQVATLATLAVLAAIAVEDWRHRRISNLAVIGLVGLFVVHAAAALDLGQALAHATVAILVFVLLLVPYARGWLGAGDVKLLAVAFLWAGVDCAFVFSLLLSVFSLGLAGLSRWGLVPAVGEGSTRRVPYGPAITTALALTLALCVLLPATP